MSTHNIMHHFTFLFSQNKLVINNGSVLLPSQYLDLDYTITRVFFNPQQNYGVNDDFNFQVCCCVWFQLSKCPCLYRSDLTVRCCHIELDPVQDTQRTQTDWGVHVRKDKVNADLNAGVASEQLFWKQNLYKVTDLLSMHILTRGRAQDCRTHTQDIQQPCVKF